MRIGFREIAVDGGAGQLRVTHPPDRGRGGQHARLDGFDGAVPPADDLQGHGVPLRRDGGVEQVTGPGPDERRDLFQRGGPDSSQRGKVDQLVHGVLDSCGELAGAAQVQEPRIHFHTRATRWCRIRSGAGRNRPSHRGSARPPRRRGPARWPGRARRPGLIHANAHADPVRENGPRRVVLRAVQHQPPVHRG